jgi:hypothetical protein
MPSYDSNATYDSGAGYDEPTVTERRHMKTKVTLGLGFLNGAETVQLGQNIHTAMTGNANFATPSPELTVLQTKLTNAQTKINDYNAAVDARALALSERDDALDELREVLNALAAYVQNVSGGDSTAIISAGMGVRNNPNPVSVGQVQNLKLKASDEDGEVFADWDRVPGARMYQVQMCTDTASPTTNWTEKLKTTKSKASLNHDLVSGTKVWVRVKALGPNNEGPWSDPAVKTVP